MAFGSGHKIWLWNNPQGVELVARVMDEVMSIRRFLSSGVAKVDLLGIGLCLCCSI
uniref:Uncharacterized protein n=1 Tax=Physcomitrium patens TaxID=3218 RepID=A0A2K1K6L8_PHYPA|nr:hypothetical protein PHYPA_011322 [Physcomitrium patens]